MSDATDVFFAELSERGHEPLLGSASGEIRFDLHAGKRTEHWRVAIKKGVVRVSRGDEAADAVVASDRELFNRIVTGEVNATAAILRGTVVVAGERDLMVWFQRILPAPTREAPA